LAVYNAYFWALAAFTVFVAAIVRGLTGFGFAAVAVVSLSLLLPLGAAVPLVLCLEVFTSVMLAGGAWQHADFAMLRRLLLAAALGVPVGVGLLTRVDAPWLSCAVYLLVALLAWLGLARVRLPMGRGALGAWLVGSSSGALIAAFSIGGPLVVAWLSHAGLRAAPLRATLILFFFAVDLVALAALGMAAAIPDTTWLLGLGLLAPLSLGLWLGQHLFRRISADAAARFTQWLLLALAGLGLCSRFWL
jgi:uncharacterized membrane protein YfcA